MDGVDAAVVELTRKRGRLLLRQIGFSALRYPRSLHHDLMAVASGSRSGALDIGRLSQRVGRRFGEAALEAVTEAGLDPSRVDAIASHGQTVGHQPGRPTITVQLGEAAVIAEATGVTTVSDFRQADTAAGGQGAPLAPFAHGELFSHPRAVRAVQNLGGIGNVTLLHGGEISGTDTGPGNMLIDSCIKILSGGRRRYDKGGAMAARGSVDGRLVDLVLAHPFFRRRLPASTGREDFGEPLAAKMVRKGRKLGLSDSAILASATMATARSIARAYRRLASSPPDECFVCGGGAANPTLMSMLADELPATEVSTTAKLGVDPQAVEAVAFAVLGYCALEGRVANIPAATGAAGPRILGKITPGANFRKAVLG